MLAKLFLTPRVSEHISWAAYIFVILGKKKIIIMTTTTVIERPEAVAAPESAAITTVAELLRPCLQFRSETTNTLSCNKWRDLRITLITR